MREPRLARKSAQPLERVTCPFGHTGKRRVDQARRHAGLLGEALGEAGKQRATAGQQDARVGDVARELRRSLLERPPDCVDDRLHRIAERLPDLVAADLHRPRETGDSVASAHLSLERPTERCGRADL